MCRPDMTKPKKAIILIGLQASGKSTCYRRLWADDYVHINLDTLHTRNKERLLLEDCLENGYSFVADNTNPTASDRQRYIAGAKARGYEVEGYFFRSVIGECINRNRTRQGKARVPDKAIACTSNRLEMPSLEEGFDRLYYVRLEDDEFAIEEWNADESL